MKAGISLVFFCFFFLSQESLREVEQAKVSVVNPLDWAKVSANVKKCELNMYWEMAVVELFAFLWD